MIRTWTSYSFTHDGDAWSASTNGCVVVLSREASSAPPLRDDWRPMIDTVLAAPLTHNVSAKSLREWIGPEQKPETCKTCNGKNEVKCDACDGMGRGECECTCGHTHDAECGDCDGDGLVGCPDCEPDKDIERPAKLLGVVVNREWLRPNAGQARGYVGLGVAHFDELDVVVASLNAGAVRVGVAQMSAGANVGPEPEGVRA